ncbi:MAG: DEAD/DEAH box helicase [Bacteroidota bacterium]
MSFISFGFSERILKGITAAGYENPTPIQSRAIPSLLGGRDIIGCAQTGTGKTAAFVLPMLERISSSQPSGKTRRPRALVVTPTRELAVQVEESVRTYGRFAGVRSQTLYGGVSIDHQIRQVRRGTDVIVATPGRLLDHLDRGTVHLSDIEVLVLDEADRMLDMGFIRDIRKIVSHVPKDRQTMLFSATMPAPIRDLAASILSSPELITVGEQRNPAETVTQHVCNVIKERKLDLLFHVLENEPVTNVIVFSRTKHGADRIVKKLAQRGFSATVMHSNRTQSQRQRALDGLKQGRFNILVATDVAARGIDINDVSHVINYDTPNQAEDYIHRIGRTGRADATGDAITFVAGDEEAYIRNIERHTGKSLVRKTYEGFEHRHEDRRPSGHGASKPASSGNSRQRSKQGGRWQKKRAHGASSTR